MRSDADSPPPRRWIPSAFTSLIAFVSSAAEHSGIVMPRKIDHNDNRLQRVVVCTGEWKGEKKEEKEPWLSDGGMLILLSFAVFIVYISYGYLQGAQIF
jgi:hypothetical protein